jgi:hypothetical protein
MKAGKTKVVRLFTEADLLQAFAEGHSRFTECSESELELKADCYLRGLLLQVHS